MAQGAAGVAEETAVGEFFGAHSASEALGMPIGVHRLNDASHDELSALAATRCKQHVEVVFTIFTALEFVENSVGEGSKTLRTPKTNNFCVIIKILGLAPNHTIPAIFYIMVH